MENAEQVRIALANVLEGKSSPAELLGIRPGIVEGLYAIGLDARERGYLEMADRSFIRCVMLDPRAAHYWLALASTRQQRGFPAEAGELFQVAALVSSDAAPIVYAAACFAEAGQLERARILAETARERCDADAREKLEPWFASIARNDNDDSNSTRNDSSNDQDQVA